MSTYPNEFECLDILNRAGCKRRVIIHCCTVRIVAGEMMKKIPCDRDLVIAGALLHDIGRSRDHSILHAAVGASMASEYGLPTDVSEIIRRHTGAGLDQQDVMEMGLPQGDYMPETIEQKIVAHADNMVSDNMVVKHKHSVDKLLMKGSQRGARRIEELHSELSLLYGEDLDVIVSSIGEYPMTAGPCSSYLRR